MSYVWLSKLSYFFCNFTEPISKDDILKAFCLLNVTKDQIATKQFCKRISVQVESFLENHLYLDYLYPLDPFDPLKVSQIGLKYYNLTKYFNGAFCKQEISRMTQIDDINKYTCLIAICPRAVLP